MPKISLRQLVQRETPLITPLAYDALSARLIQRAGFQAMGIGGSGMLASRYGLPDVGIAALGEMAAGIADIVAATDLPVMVDGDDGYGDVKSVVRMMEVYGRAGVSGIVLEDQLRDGKRPGEAGAVGVAGVAEMSRKIRAAAGARPDPEIQLVARCDAYATEGIDACLRRLDAYFSAGADGGFIPSVKHADDLRKIGAAFHGRHLVAAMFEGRDTWLPPAELSAMGFTQLVFPGLLFSRVVHTIDMALGDLMALARDGKPMPPVADAKRAETALKEAVDIARWDAIHTQP
jgi:2-methylisocitrate lyase-like PEP mutase family enzyme